MKAIYYNPPIESTYIHHILKEIYTDRVYHPILAGRKGLTILDVGANIGLTSEYFSKFAKKVYSIEPSQLHFDCLTQLIKHNKLSKVKPYKYAVGKEDGTMTLHHNDNSTMYSLNKAVSNSGGEEVEVVTLKTLFKKLKIKNVDFMKLDVEGVEVEIVSSPEFKQVAKKIDTILLEYHTWSGRHPGQVVQALQNCGYQVAQVPSDATLFVAKRI